VEFSCPECFSRLSKPEIQPQLAGRAWQWRVEATSVKLGLARSTGPVDWLWPGELPPCGEVIGGKRARGTYDECILQWQRLTSNMTPRSCCTALYLHRNSTVAQPANCLEWLTSRYYHTPSGESWGQAPVAEGAFHDVATPLLFFTLSSCCLNSLSSSFALPHTTLLPTTSSINIIRLVLRSTDTAVLLTIF
jgi:hypothetical protein